MAPSAEEAPAEPRYVLRRRGGANLVQQPPQFSPDHSLLFVISGFSIQIYNVETSEFIKSLKSDENSSSIISMDFLSSDDRSLITCNKVGKIITWKWHAAVQSSEKKIKLPQNSYVQTFKLLNDDEAVVCWCTIKNVQMGIVKLSSGEIVRRPTFSKIKIGVRWSFALGYCNDSSVLAFSNGTSKVYIFDTTNPSKAIDRQISNMNVTSLAWHPTSEMLAVGDALGRINLFRQPFSEAFTHKEILHWHHLPLTSIVFSPKGGLLLTGGSERVLVAWGANNSRKFIPRFPAPICHIAAGNSHIAVSTTDNSIQIVESSSLRIVGCVREAGGLGGVKYQKNENVKSPALQYIRSAAALLLPAGSGHLHLYSTVSNSLMYTMDVTNANIVHPEQNNLDPEQIEVTCISVGCRGQWLVTWEGVNEQERIRWWEWSGHDWKLHTLIARPHRPAAPSAIHLAADTPVTLSADQQNNIRIWRIMDTVPGYEGKSAWYTNARCRGSGGDAGGATLSGDGSVAAAWFGARLTLWDTLEGNQKASLAHPALRPQGKFVQFGRGQHMHYIACTTDTCLAVWNTMTLRLMWMVKLNTSCLISDPFSDKVVAVTDTNDVFLFRMPDSKPLLTLENILPIDQGAITSITFAPTESTTDDFRLYLLREQQEIFVIERSESISNIEPTLERIGEAAKTIPSAYSAMIAEKEANLVIIQQNTYQAQPSTKVAINDLLLSSAAHAQPKLSNLCSSVLRALVGVTAVNNINDSSNLTSADVKDKITSTEDNVNKDFKKIKKKKLFKESMDWAVSLISED